jgi:hypothetical protein
MQAWEELFAPVEDPDPPKLHFWREEEEPKTIWERLASKVFSNRPTYVIVDRDGTYYAGKGRHFSQGYDGEWEPYGPTYDKWTRKPEEAIVYETLKGAKRRLKRLGRWGEQHAAIVAAIREEEEQIVECEEWLEHTSPTAAISTGASTEITTAQS